MNKKTNIENAAAVFAKNKGVAQLYFTNDGQAFQGLEAARTHQKEISGNIEGLHLVKNAEYEGSETVMAEDVAAPAEAAATDGKNKGKSSKKNSDPEPGAKAGSGA